MSYTLAFWSGGDNLDPLETYRNLDVEPIEAVRVVDSTELDRALAVGLPGWTRDDIHFHPPGVEVGSAPVFELYVGERIVDFTGIGIEDGEHFNAIIDVMHPLGYRLYDPQVNERFGRAAPPSGLQAG
ncbi:hypothetical protein [Microbacterium phyllosphaerae]|uniref:hypothetical protein n=1 Tax=Microbacterium phyllosphaerae TaxID=124798 RepID=UPI000EA384BF|nr:hypothetical protein [Microbacterium phyllosphaerae]